MCVVGDLNFHHINWENLTGNGEADDFLEVALDNFSEQHVTSPTRGNNILDLVLSNKENLIKKFEVAEELASSDHKSISFSIKLRNKIKENNVLVPNFRKANFKRLKDTLKRSSQSINLAQAVHFKLYIADQNEQGRMQVSSGSVNVAYNNFITSLQDKQSEFIPKKSYDLTQINLSGWLTNYLT